MKVDNPENYRFDRFEKSHLPSKKYDGILVNLKTGREKRVPFGDRNYTHYKDRTGLGVYSKLDHEDSKRRASYHARHKGEGDNKFSSGWFALKFLW